MKEKEGKLQFSLQESTHRNLKYSLTYRLCIVQEPFECFTISNFIGLFLQHYVSDNIWWVVKKKKVHKLLKVEELHISHGTPLTRQRPPFPPFRTDTQITLPRLVLKSSSSSIILYTYTKLRTPVFIVKWCYAYLYCMYVCMYIPSSALKLCSFIYPKVKCNNNQYFEAKCFLLL